MHTSRHKITFTTFEKLIKNLLVSDIKQKYRKNIMEQHHLKLLDCNLNP